MTKKKRKELIRALIDRQQRYVVWSAADTAEMNELTGWAYKLYKWIDNPQFPSDPRCVSASDDGQSWEVHSWNKAVDGYSTQRNLNEAMRDAIREDMREHMRTSAQECAECKTTDDLCVDHKIPPFITIANEYLELNKDLETALINGGFGAGWRMHPRAASLWRKFHAERATYQVLCRSCNSRKGARN